MSSKPRGSFSSGFGAIAAAAGSAIGLGNIWRFPYVAGENGGAAFIFIYLIIVLLIGIPLMMSEFALGRRTKQNVFGAFRTLAPGKKWYMIGILGIATAFTILSFYSVVAGWTVAFVKSSLLNEFGGMGSTAIKESFEGFVASGWKPILWTFLFIGITGFIVGNGVEKGIERYNKILMPVLFLILIILCINSVSLTGFRAGMNFLFSPDFSKIDGNVILNALGQAFFSLSLGMGTMMTYGSYIRKKDNLLSTAGSVAFADILIAILAGIAIFPAVFSFGIEPSSGPDLVYITLPNIFQQITGGYWFSILFFVLLLVAALTSAVSLMEVVVAYCHEELKMSRIKSVVWVSVLLMILGSLCALSQMPDSSISIAGNNLFDLFDKGSSTYMLPIGGFFIALFCGWSLNKKDLKQELTSEGKYRVLYFPVYRFVVKFISPVVIALIFLNQIGLLRF